MRRAGFALTALAAVLAGSSVTGNDGPPLDPAVLAIEGDADWGAYLAGECLTCHRADGLAEGIPRITGWEPDDFVTAMHAYKQNWRTHPIMQMVAGRLSDEEIAALAAYFKDLE